MLSNAVKGREPRLSARVLAGDLLRRLREASGMSREKAGRLVDVNRSTIWRIERGHVQQDASKIARLLTLYGVTDEWQRDTVIGLATGEREPGWWDRSGLPLWARTYFRLEAAAGALHEYAPGLVPDLLQTPGYARAAVLIERPPPGDADHVDRQVEVRMLRQRPFARPDGPRLWAIVDEAALLRVVGTREVHADQLDALIDAARRPNITLQVLRLEHAAYLPRCGPFTLLRFPRAPDIVYLDQLAERHPVRGRRDTDAYRHAHASLSVTAEMPGETTRILTGIRASLPVT
jgi:Predicted transcriptional regulators